jgi:hypothetical protein
MTPHQTRRCTIKELYLVHQGFERRMRRQELHVLGTRNEVRAFGGADPINPYQGSAAMPKQDDQEALDALKYRHRDFFEEDLT